jgi:hypothetical protein
MVRKNITAGSEWGSKATHSIVIWKQRKGDGKGSAFPISSSRAFSQ